MRDIDVLIIDDEIKFAGMLSKRLTLRGVTCKTCYDGTSGIEALKTHTFRTSPIVLLDLNLPDIYGTQVLVEIKKINPDIRIIIVTGHGTESDKEECLRLGAFDFVNKPVNIDQIISALNLAKGENVQTP